MYFENVRVRNQGIINREPEGKCKFESKNQSARAGQIFYKDDWRRHDGNSQ
jgi:hypothetical protein